MSDVRHVNCRRINLFPRRVDAAEHVADVMECCGESYESSKSGCEMFLMWKSYLLSAKFYLIKIF